MQRECTDLQSILLQSKSTIFSQILSQYPWKFYYHDRKLHPGAYEIGITVKSPELPFYINIDFSFLKGHHIKKRTNYL